MNDLPKCVAPVSNRWSYVAIAIGAAAAPVFAQDAARDLSGYSAPGVTFTVSIAIDTPPGTNAVGLEDAPPTGWVVSAISDNGLWDPVAEKVKWLFLFDPPFPTEITYDVTPATGASSDSCFEGKVSFDGPEQPIGGDLCIVVDIPAVSDIGLMMLGLLVLAAGAIVVTRSRDRAATASGR